MNLKWACPESIIYIFTGKHGGEGLADYLQLVEAWEGPRHDSKEQRDE